MSFAPTVMLTDPFVLDRIFDRLGRTLSAGGPDQLRAPFTVGDIMHSLVPYRTYRHELQVDTLQDYEHALLELLSGERSLLICDPDTVALIRKELASPDPDTGILRRLQTAQVRMGALRMPVMTLIQPIAWPEEDAADSAPLPTPTPTHAPTMLTTTLATPAATAFSAPFSAPVVTQDSVDGPTPPDDDLDAPAMPVLEARSVVPAPAVAVAPDSPSSTEPIAPTLVSPAPAATVVMRPSATPIGVTSIYGDPIGFRGVRHAPVDVGGVIFLFGMVARELGFHVEAMSSGFPRCEAKRQLAPGKWTRVRIEFEVESRHFHDAGRAASACDLLICWRDTWPDRPSTLEVLSLELVLPTLAPQE